MQQKFVIALGYCIAIPLSVMIFPAFMIFSLTVNEIFGVQSVGNVSFFLLSSHGTCSSLCLLWMNEPYKQYVLSLVYRGYLLYSFSLVHWRKLRALVKNSRLGLVFSHVEKHPMPYNYHYDIATSRTKVIFKLLFRWRASVWQAVYVELIAWIVMYCLISVIYRTALDTPQRRTFEDFAEFCDKRMAYLPLNFMLGFFVTIVVNRWVTQFANLGMIDNIALFTSFYVKGKDERGRQLRRNIVRYCCLSQALVFRDIHIGVRHRFPTIDTLVASGFMMTHELEKFDQCKSRYAKYWLPFNWSLHLLNVAKNEGRIEGDIPRNAVAEEIRAFRSGLSLIWTYDWVPLPIMYPQLVYLAVHAYFFICLFSRQFIITPDSDHATEIDLYVPFMSILEFIFYMGWLKVAMALLNPFGEDDDDFDLNFLLDRNLTVALTSVDEAFDDIPDVQPDLFYNDTVSPLYSMHSALKTVNFYLGSANKSELPDSVTEIQMVPHPINEKIDHYIQKPARRRRTSIVSVRTVRSHRKGSIISHISNVFRRRKSSASSEGVPGYCQKRRSCTLVSSPPAITVQTDAYSNPTFLEMDEDGFPNHFLKPSDDHRSRAYKSQRLGGNVKNHIQKTRSFNVGDRAIEVETTDKEEEEEEKNNDYDEEDDE